MSSPARAALTALVSALALACGPQTPPPGRHTPPPIVAPQPSAEAPAAAPQVEPRPRRPICDDAADALARARQRLAPARGAPSPLGDLSALLALLTAVDADLQTHTADAQIAALLRASEASAEIDAVAAIDAAIARWWREQLRRAADDKRERPALVDAWHLAECGYELMSPALADALAAEELAAGIAAAFADGRRAIADDKPDLALALAIDRQRVEKRFLTAAHRELLKQAGLARGGDRLAARRAAAAFALLADRLESKNTPAIARIDAMLAGPPEQVDPALIGREVAVAIAKRTRKYCSESAGEGMPGTLPGRAAAVEGATYARLLAPDMEARLAGRGFDRAAHLAAWDAFVVAVEEGEDAAEVKRLSDELVHWNCAYQEALGIRECTASQDEIAAPAAPAP